MISPGVGPQAWLTERAIAAKANCRGAIPVHSSVPRGRLANFPPTCAATHPFPAGVTSQPCRSSERPGANLGSGRRGAGTGSRLARGFRCSGSFRLPSARVFPTPRARQAPPFRLLPSVLLPGEPIPAEFIQALWFSTQTGSGKPALRPPPRLGSEQRKPIAP